MADRERKFGVKHLVCVCCKQPVPFSAVDGLWSGVFLRLRLYAVIDDLYGGKVRQNTRCLWRRVIRLPPDVSMMCLLFPGNKR